MEAVPRRGLAPTMAMEEELEDEDDGFWEAISAVICSAVVLISSLNLMLWL